MATGTTMLLAAALAAGAAGAGAVLLLSGAPSPAAPPPAVSGAGIASLEERVARQEEEIARLRDRLEEALRERPPLPAPREDGSAPPPGEGPAADPSFEEKYREAREKERSEQRETKEAQTEATLRARLHRHPARAHRSQKMPPVARPPRHRPARRGAVSPLTRAAGTPEAFRTSQERAAEVRAEARKALGALLTEEQVKALEDADGGGRQGRAGRFGGRPGAGGAGGGGAGGRRDGPGAPPR